MDKCVVCGSLSKKDGRYIKRDFYHDDCIELLMNERKLLQERLKFSEKFANSLIERITKASERIEAIFKFNPDVEYLHKNHFNVINDILDGNYKGK